MKQLELGAPQRKQISFENGLKIEAHMTYDNKIIDVIHAEFPETQVDLRQVIPFVNQNSNLSKQFYMAIDNRIDISPIDFFHKMRQATKLRCIVICHGCLMKQFKLRQDVRVDLISSVPPGLKVLYKHDQSDKLIRIKSVV